MTFGRAQDGDTAVPHAYGAPNKKIIEIALMPPLDFLFVSRPLLARHGGPRLACSCGRPVFPSRAGSPPACRISWNHCRPRASRMLMPCAQGDNHPARAAHRARAGCGDETDSPPHRESRPVPPGPALENFTAGFALPAAGCCLLAIDLGSLPAVERPFVRHIWQAVAKHVANVINDDGGRSIRLWPQASPTC